MTKVLIYSIQPQHMLNILNGNKTIEIRKRDLPQWVKESLAQGEVVEGYGYCTKGDVDLYHNIIEKDYVLCDGKNNITYYDGDFQKAMMSKLLNGKVVFKFEVSGSDKIPFIDSEDWVLEGYYDIQPHDIPLKACLDIRQLNSYGNGADLYAHHFTNITPIEPMDIKEFYSRDVIYERVREVPHDKTYIKDGKIVAVFDDASFSWVVQPKELTKAPQSFMTAWVKEVGE